MLAGTRTTVLRDGILTGVEGEQYGVAEEQQEREKTGSPKVGPPARCEGGCSQAAVPAVSGYPPHAVKTPWPPRMAPPCCPPLPLPL